MFRNKVVGELFSLTFVATRRNWFNDIDQDSEISRVRSRTRTWLTENQRFNGRSLSCFGLVDPNDFL